MSGFSPAMMSGLMMANTALTSAKANAAAISHMDTRRQTLEGEIKSGVGDVEGKQAELEEIKEQRARAEAMQQDALSTAGSYIGNAAAEDAEKTDKVGVNKDTQTPSDKAKDKAEDLEKKHPDHDIAAVDYGKGMQISSEDGKTTVAVSPEFLEKMDADPALENAYSGFMDTMRELENKGPDVSSQTWAVAKNGTISRWAVVSQQTSDAELASIRESMQAAGKEAFGDLYGSTTVSRDNAASAAGTSAAGMLIDTAV